MSQSFSFFKQPSSTECYTLSLHDALPIWQDRAITDRAVDVYVLRLRQKVEEDPANPRMIHSVRGFGYTFEQDRKSTRLNSSHRTISYAVFCLKKKTTDLCNEQLVVRRNTA